MSKRLAIISTHPIQYYAPYFRLLSQRGNAIVKVFYTWGDDVLKEKYDPGFKKNIKWDIPLLDGYDYEFLENIAKDKGSHHFGGINNPYLIKRIEEWKPDAIFIIGWGYVSHLKAMRHFKGKIPLIFRGDSTLLDEKESISLKKILRYFVLKWVYRHVDIAMYVGENNKKYFKKFGLKENQLVYAPHAIDNDRFSDTEKSYELGAKEWRQSLGISENDIVFAFAGKLESKKDPGLLLEAFQNVNRTGIHLVFIGNGVLEDDLKQRAAAGKNIHFIDFQNQSRMPVAYRLADVFVLPSKGPDETWGLAINEAMACGRPVIASDKCGGAVDLISHGENGYIFRYGSVLELQKVMEACVNNAERLKKMGETSIKKIRNFSFDRIVNSLELILSK